MIAITSVSPNHVNKDIQQKAINSWNKLGMDCYSFNHPSEIPKLINYTGIKFIETEQTMEHMFKNHYINISQMMEWAKKQTNRHSCFINSDIELDKNDTLLHNIKEELDNDKIIICHRNDYIKNKSEAQPYILGIDVFFLNYKHLKLFPASLLCMGQCFWDYNIPYTAIINWIEVINLQNKFAFHKKHPIQYSDDNWELTGKLFAIDHGIKINDIGRLNELVFNFLQLNMKKTEL